MRGMFRRRKMPLSPDYRPLYKISTVCIILDLASTGAKSSLNRLHFLIWAVRSEKSRQFIRSTLANLEEVPVFTWGVEPALNKALALGVAEGLWNVDGRMYVLTELDKKLSKSILSTSGLFEDEILLLKEIGKRGVTEALINTLTKKANE